MRHSSVWRSIASGSLGLTTTRSRGAIACAGAIYLVAALVLGAVFTGLAVQLLRTGMEEALV